MVRHLRWIGLALLGALAGAGSFGAPAKAGPACVNGTGLSTIVVQHSYDCSIGVVTYKFNASMGEISFAGGQLAFTDGGLMVTRDPDDPLLWNYTLTQTIRLENLNYDTPSELAAWNFRLSVRRPDGLPGAAVPPGEFMPSRTVTPTFAYTPIGNPPRAPLDKVVSPTSVYGDLSSSFETWWMPSFSVLDSPTAQGLDIGAAEALSFDLRTDQRLDSVTYVFNFSGGSSSELYPGATIVPTAVPEPGTLGLTLLALVAFMAACSSRRRRA